MITYLILVLLVALNILAALILWIVYRHVMTADEVLQLARRSFRVSDARAEDAATAAAHVAAEVKGAVAEVPAKVVQKMAELGSESGTKLPIVKPGGSP